MKIKDKRKRNIFSCVEFDSAGIVGGKFIAAAFLVAAFVNESMINIFKQKNTRKTFYAIKKTYR